MHVRSRSLLLIAKVTKRHKTDYRIFSVQVGVSFSILPIRTSSLLTLIFLHARRFYEVRIVYMYTCQMYRLSNLFIIIFRNLTLSCLCIVTLCTKKWNITLNLLPALIKLIIPLDKDEREIIPS